MRRQPPPQAEARELLIDLPGLARQLPSDMMTMAYAYTSAVLASDDDADELFADGLAALPTGARLIRARLFLHHGRRLRRQARDSRALLRTARDEFDLLGALPWAEMARAELRAAGETSGLPRRSMSAQLSAQELQIATPVHLAPHRQRPPAPHPRHHRRGRPVFLMSATVAGGVS